MMNDFRAKVIDEFCSFDAPTFLCIAGPSGCGKTHLLRDMKSRMEQEDTSRNVLLIDNHVLLSFLLEAFVSKTYPSFVNGFSIYDVILIDLFEDISEKRSTIEEHLHLFSTLLQQGKSIAVSLCIRSNKPADTELCNIVSQMSLCDHQYTVHMEQRNCAWR